MTKDKKKLKAQVKSRFYYLFWGIATLSVFAGQLYVGTGYRMMSKSFNRIMDAIVIGIEGKTYGMDGLGCKPSIEYYDL